VSKLFITSTRMLSVTALAPILLVVGVHAFRFYPDPDGEEFAGNWIPDTWNAVQAYNPEVLGTYGFNGRGIDICHKAVRPNATQEGEGGCWETRSKWQQSVIVDTGPKDKGKILYLDCEPQSSQGDEHIYHESLVHPAMVVHGAPKRVFIAGGGEGGTAREILRYAGVEKVMMVDLDDNLMELSRHHLPYWGEVNNDPRLELHVGDAVAWLKQHPNERYDVVILDLPDCTKSTAFLYRPAIFELVQSRLLPGGVVASHGGGDLCTDASDMCRFLPQLARTWTNVFGSATPLVSPMPLWHILHAFISTSPQGGTRLHELSAKEVDGRLDSLLGERRKELKYYSGGIHRLMLTSRHPPYETFLKKEKEDLSKWQGEGARGMSQMHECGCNSARCLWEDGHRGDIDSRDGAMYQTMRSEEGDGEEEDENTKGGAKEEL